MVSEAGGISVIPEVCTVTGMVMLPEPSKAAEPEAPPDSAIVRGVTRAAALLSFLPVPPLAMGSMPVTPGVMLAEPSKDAAAAAARLV